MVSIKGLRSGVNQQWCKFGCFVECCFKGYAVGIWIIYF